MQLAGYLQHQPPLNYIVAYTFTSAIFPFLNKFSKHQLTVHQDRHHDDAKASSASSLSVVKSDATSRLFAAPATAEVHSGLHFYFEGKVSAQ